MTAEAEICRRIQLRKAITFAEFMDLALYWPDGGYYAGAGPSRDLGDYYTSPMAHPAFGALLALQLFQMWQLLDRPRPFTVVEMGAGNGLLCRDITSFSAHIDQEFNASLRYVCLDRRLTAGEERRSGKASRVASAGIPFRGVRGCFLSNEFLDAFPVHQLRVVDGRLLEVYVALDQGNLVATLEEPSTPELSERLRDLDLDLAEGQTVEINLGLDRWAEDVGSALDAGFVLSIDYGLPAAQLYSAAVRPRGTLTTYYRHLQTDSPFRRVGQQDISSQVDFTSAARAQRNAGLEMLGITTQGRFLNNLGLDRFRNRLPPPGLPPGAWQENRAGLMDLVRPGGLGEFKVMVQGKNAGHPRLWGWDPPVGPSVDSPVDMAVDLMNLVETLELPLLTPQHLSRREGRYPPGEFELDLDGLWPPVDESAGESAGDNPPSLS